MWELQPTPRLRVHGKATWWKSMEPRDRNGDARPMKRNRQKRMKKKEKLNERKKDREADNKEGGGA